MTKATELREMSDEQLQFTLKESAESLFRLRIQGPDRAAQRPQRTAQAPADDRPRQNDPERAGPHGCARKYGPAAQAKWQAK